MPRCAHKGLTLILFILLFSFSTTPESQAETATETLLNMVNTLEADIQHQEQIVTEINKNSPSMTARYEQRLHKAQVRMDQLKMLRGMAKQTPWSYRTVLMQLHDLGSYVRLAKADLLIEKNRLKKIKAGFDVINEIHFKTKITDPLLKQKLIETKTEYERVRDDASAVKRNLDAELEKSDRLMEYITEATKVTEKFYASTLKRFYFQPHLILFFPQAWKDISYSFAEWQESYTKFYHPLIVWVEWGNFLLIMSGITVFLWLTLRYLVKKMLRRPMFSKHQLSFYNKGLFLISLGAAILFARFFTLFTANQVTGLVWTEIITLGAIICTRNFLWAREKVQPAPLIYTPMFILWSLMTAGDIMHMLTLPAECLSVIWFVLSLSGLAALHFNRRRYVLPITQATSQANKVILGSGALLTLVGFGTQAMILTQIWFLFLVTMKICTALKTIMITDLPQPEYLPPEEEPDAEQQVKMEQAYRQARHHNQMVQLFYPLSISIIIFLFIGWATAYMGGIPFAHFVFRHLDMNIAGVDISVKNISYILILFFAARLALFWLKSFVSNASINGQRIESALAHTLSTIGSYIVWVVFLLTSFFLLGIPMSALTWIASGLSIGIGFGMKDIVSNFVSGLIILFGGSIKKGDTLQHKKIIGTVADVSIRNTTIKALDNSMVIIPNSSFLKGEIVNLNYQDTRIRATIPLTLVPGSKVKKAKKIMMKVVKKHPKVLKDPAPNILFKRFGTLGLDFEILFWVSHFEDKFPTESDIVDELDQKFQGKKIKVAFRGVKTKYKPKGDEAAQIAARREALKEKRKLVSKCFRSAALRKHRFLNKIEMDKPE
ncbi:mechanosensitive ion channel family protein [Desulfovibrio sp. JC010]|uniref:mechanosensitive ion channel family protein n=1 Tax=Desulfovibrio sp. JC010 TaxID=2593641 RepID=UPI0013D5D40B|nr:mechanosensitive ion channel domain-containing protein [Desulfovibrio sp. JC010]NDV25109.1 mechanosensitive ion channel [Desulfovibrio sp. JC010]